MQQSGNFWTGKSTLLGIAIILFLMLCTAYSNHFNNTFQFDDTHAIVDNAYIRDIKNLPLFFKEVKYFGTNLNNQAYRPVVVSFNAIDYWLGGGLNPFYFHLDIFISYLAFLYLLFLFYKRIFDKTVANAASQNSLVALLAVGFFGIHAANAETVNYIIQRADSFSTLLMVATLLLYINPKSRKYYLYLITAALAMATKETAIMTGVLLFFYILLFEENMSLTELATFKKFKKGTLRALKKSLPTLLLTLVIYDITQTYLVGPSYVKTVDAMPKALNYYATEAVVFTHYIGNFIAPLDLSIGSGFSIYSVIFTPKVIYSAVLCITLFIIAFVTSRNKATRPIAFGIVWFYVGLVPSSFFIKSGEPSNDHRTFLPYVGLVLSLAWWLRILYLRYEHTLPKHKSLPIIVAASYFLLVSLHAYGTRQRNIVWSTYENLWHDALLKNPDNPMALMNYGLVLMSQGKYDETLICFERVLANNPGWAYINVNMAILKDNMGKPQEAEPYFKNAILYQPFYPVGYYQYARFLSRYGRIEEAREQLAEGLKVSPGDAQILDFLKTLTPEAMAAKKNKVVALAEQNPSADNYINLSLFYFQNKMYNECIEACEKALKADPKRAMAYNNICASYNALQQWTKAEEACLKSIRLDSALQMAKVNLVEAQKHLK